MEPLIRAIHTTPIIDNHAHPLLTLHALEKYNLLAITTEAHGDAMRNTPSTLSHIRAVDQLSTVLSCQPTWDDVVTAVEKERQRPDDIWAKRCFQGIETVLVDDGLDGKDEVFDYAWHNRLTRSKCKRIVRIEKVAEEIVDELLKLPSISPEDIFHGLLRQFESRIKDAIADPEVVGFKSVICYRTGLYIPPVLSMAEAKTAFIQNISELRSEGINQFRRIDGQPLNALLVDKTASMIENSKTKLKKPLQFHTGLGDNDIMLTTSSPSHLQGFIRKFPTVPIVLLHASYPWTQEAGYLASVYENVYADFGEVFPFLSKDGQERVVREILELTPTEKVLWSTDGHWFPETYLLAVIQMREALEAVLSESVQKKAMTVPQAVKIVEDVLFNTSNTLYGLDLQLKPLVQSSTSLYSTIPSSFNTDPAMLQAFVNEHHSTKFLRIQYTDYTGMSRLRVIPVKRALTLLQTHPHLSVGMTKSCLGMLQNDVTIPGVGASGEYKLQAIFSSIRPGPSEEYASIQGEFMELDGSEALLCPRSFLRRRLEDAKTHSLKFLIGYEIEVIFLSPPSRLDNYTTLHGSGGHAWNSARALHSKKVLDMLTKMYDTLASAGIYLEQFHPESGTGQYEFVLPPLPPLEAVDTLIHAREIIMTVAASFSLRATLHPKPIPNKAGTASHVHISICSPNGKDEAIYSAFYAGILGHLRALAAFTYSNPASFERVQDGCWAGGRYVGWGTQNRETPLRKIDGSHWEVKCLDGLANPYLALGALITAGTMGVVEKNVLTWADCQGDPASLTGQEKVDLGIKKMLPERLQEALSELILDERLNRALGKEVVSRYVGVKRAEMKLLDGMEGEEKREWIIERY